MGDIFVTKSFLPEFDEYVNEIRDIWHTFKLTNMGNKHRKFQAELQNLWHVDNVELFTNGHMSLELTMQAMELKGEVITTPFTFASTTHAIIRSGLTPVFCDIDLSNFTLQTENIESLITDNTAAILPVHVYGNVCNVEAIDEIAKRHSLKVIYDAAHTFGVTYKGKSVASYGDVACYSFHATKTFNSIEGGAVSYKDSRLSEKLRFLKNFGIRDAEHIEMIGCNAKMNEFCAAMGLCNLRHYEEELKKRKLIHDCYRNLLYGIPGLQLNVTQSDVQPNYGYFPIVVHENEFGVDRDVVFEKLAAINVHARKYFYPLTNCFQCFKGIYSSNDTPNAKYISDRILCLPIYGQLGVNNVEDICKQIKKCRG